MGWRVLVMYAIFIYAELLPCLDASGRNIDLDVLWHSETSIKDCTPLRLADIYQRADKNIIFNSVMCGPESLGNFLSVYLESTLCANLTGMHLVSLKRKAIEGEPESLPDFFPRFVYNEKNLVRNIKNFCLCTNDICHEHPNALIHSNPLLVRDILRPPILRHYQEWLSESSTHSRPISPWKHTLRPPYNSEGVAKLPLIPEAAIHYRYINQPIRTVP